MIDESPPSSDPFSTLLQRARAGDSAAFVELCQPCLEKLRQRAELECMPAGSMPENPSDLVISTQRILLQKLPDIPKGITTQGQFCAWLISRCHMLASNKREHWRRQKRDVRREAGLEADSSLPDESPSPASRLSSMEVLAQVQACIARLPPKLREVFNAAEVEELPEVEVARRLGLSVDKIHKMRRTAKARLALCLREHGMGPEVP